jgi:hypothetical protein
VSGANVIPPRNGRRLVGCRGQATRQAGDRLETVEGSVEAGRKLRALSLALPAPSVSLRDPPPRSGEEWE